MQWGRLAITGTGAPTGSGTVTFPVPFAASWQVVATRKLDLHRDVQHPTTSSAVLTIPDRNDNAVIGTADVSWLAIGLA